MRCPYRSSCVHQISRLGTSTDPEGGALGEALLRGCGGAVRPDVCGRFGLADLHLAGFEPPTLLGDLGGPGGLDDLQDGVGIWPVGLVVGPGGQGGAQGMDSSRPVDGEPDLKI